MFETSVAAHSAPRATATRRLGAYQREGRVELRRSIVGVVAPVGDEYEPSSIPAERAVEGVVPPGFDRLRDPRAREPLDAYGRRVVHRDDAEYREEDPSGDEHAYAEWDASTQLHSRHPRSPTGGSSISRLPATVE